jgi:hypothetical protein
VYAGAAAWLLYLAETVVQYWLGVVIRDDRVYSMEHRSVFHCLRLSMS